MAILLAVYDEGSLRRAAATLGVTPAAVSKAVRQMEERLGEAVFERSASGMQPTVRAQSLLDSGRGALMELARAEEAFRKDAGAFSGTVRIGSGPIPARDVATLIVPEAKRRWPGVRLELELGRPDELIAAMARGSLELAICHVQNIDVPPTVHCSVLQELRAVAMARADHPLLAGAPVPPAAVTSYGLASFPPYLNFVNWYAAQTGAQPDFALIGPDYEMLADAVAGSDLLLMCSHTQANRMARTHGLVELQVRWEPFLHRVCLLTSSRAISAPGKAIAGLIRDLMATTEA